MRKLIVICVVTMLFGTNYAMAGGVTLNKPGATSTQITDIDGSNTIGQYKTADNVTHGFLYDVTKSAVDSSSWITLDPPEADGGAWSIGVFGSKVVGGYNILQGAGQPNVLKYFLYDGDTRGNTTLNMPSSLGVMSGINGVLGNNVIGSYNDASNWTTSHHGFLYDGTNWTKFEPIGGNWTSSNPIGVSGSQVIGSYYTGGNEYTIGDKHVFLYDGDKQSWTTINPPGLFSNISSLAVSGNNIVGNYQHGDLISGFLYDVTKPEKELSSWITIEMDGATRTTISDISDSNVIGSYTSDADNYQHSFLYDLVKKSYTNIDNPDAKNTIVNAIDGSDIVGYHMSSPAQGYFYTIPEPSTLVLSITALISSFFLYRKFNH